MKRFLQFFRRAPAEDILVLASEGEALKESSRRSFADIFFFVSLGIIFLMTCFSWVSTGALIEDYESFWRKYYQTSSERETAEMNLDSLKLLSSQEETIRDQQAVVEQAIPFDSGYEQVVSFIEFLVDTVKEKTWLDLPENISWRRVLASDVSNESHQPKRDLLDR